jgi:hypothetical protein
LVVLIFTKDFVNSFSVLLAAFVCDAKRLQTFRLRWFDLPMIAWCISPFISNFTNDMALKDSITSARDQTLVWGVPYFLGRVYFNDLAKFRELAIGVVIGGLLYAPMCVVEAKWSPLFHQRVYGYSPASADEAVRGSGLFTFRPVMFMSHGLAVGMWMVTATLFAFWLWWTGSVNRLAWKKGYPPLRMIALVAVLLGTSLVINSTGAFFLGVMGLVALCQVRFFKVPILVAVLLTFPPFYIVGRSWTGATRIDWQAAVNQDEQKKKDRDDGKKPPSAEDAKKIKSMQKPLFGWGWTGREVVDWLKTNVSPDRASSQEFRWINEDMLMEKAWEKPVFGWGDQGQSRIKTAKTGEVVSVPDGMWILTLGDLGFFGLIAVYSAMLLPSARFLWSVKPQLWSHPSFAAPGVAALVLILYMFDCLSNNMFNSVFVLMSGGLAGLASVRLRPIPLTVAEPIQQEVPNEPPPASPPPVAARPGVLVRRRPLPK